LFSSIIHKGKAAASGLPLIKHVAQRSHLRRKFATELQLIKGRHQNFNAHPSIIHFSINKAATQYVKSILIRASTANGLAPVDIHDYAFNTNFPYLDNLSEEQMVQYRHIFRPQGYLYSVFGGMVEGIEDLNRYKIVLVLRDPRDILVSRYFSIAYSHFPPPKSANKYSEFVARRLEAKSLSIDEYVVAESDQLYGEFRRYKDLLLSKYPMTYVATYENMTRNFEAWLSGLLRYCQLDLNPSQRRELHE
jgi:hypothetical protein